MSRSLVGPGAAGIASLFVQAGSKCSPDHRSPEFGTMVSTDGILFLQTDSYTAKGIGIPPHDQSAGGYRILKGFRAGALQTSSTDVGDHGGHTHTAPDVDQETSIDLLDGDRVALVWIGPSPLIIGRI